MYLNTIMLPTSLLQYKKKKVIQYPDCGGYRRIRDSVSVLKSELNYLWLLCLWVRSHLACKLATGAFRNLTFIHWNKYSEKILSWFYFTLSKRKCRLQCIGWGEFKSLYLTYVSIRKDYPIICMFIIIYAWVSDNGFKNHYPFRGLSTIYFL